MEAANILDAASQGASTAIMLVLNIGASLVAFLAFVEFINQIISKYKQTIVRQRDPCKLKLCY